MVPPEVDDNSNKEGYGGRDEEDEEEGYDLQHDRRKGHTA
jgi:hypothetical protein